jgi:tRNA-dihydrouridine synthase
MTRKHNLSVIKEIIITHAQLAWKNKKSAGILELRKHLGWYVKGFPGASETRQKLVRVKNLQEIKDILSCL